MIEKEQLAQLIQDNSQKKIAEMFGCSQRKICRLLKKYGIASPRVGNAKPWKKRKYLCLFCGESLNGRSRRKYCSRKCCGAHRRKKIIDSWLSGEFSGSMKWLSITTLSSSIRRFLIEQAGNKCQKCTWSEKNIYSGKVPLEIAHKDGNYKNNRPENLAVWCPNCHAINEDHRSNRIGNGRYSTRSVKVALHRGAEMTSSSNGKDC